MVNPADRSVQVCLLENGLYRTHEVYSPKDIAKVNALEGCFIEMCKVFPD